MKRKLLICILAIIAVATSGLFFLTSCSDSSDNKMTFYKVDDGYELSKVPQNFVTVEIPSEYKKKPVVAIGMHAFDNCKDLESVTIPDTVTVIKDNAFLNCVKLSGINIPSTVTEIQMYAFSGCSSLTEITLPAGLTTLGAWAFDKCTALKSITVPDGITEIQSSTFKECSSLESITLGKGITSFGQSAFYDCIGLKDVYISDIAAWCQASFENSTSNPLYYGKNLYAGGNKITTLVIPEGVEKIEKYAFNSCSTLESVTIPDSVKSIGDHSFAYCTRLTEVKVGNGLTEVGRDVFYYCINLKSIALPDSVKSIGDNILYGCAKLESITLPFLGASATDTKKNFIGYSFGALSATLSDTYIPKTLKTVVIGGGSIAEHAFSNCIHVENVTLSDEITEIGPNAFSYCTGLSSINLPKNLTLLNDYVFNGCTALESIKLPEGLKSIGKYAFRSCATLKSIEIPDSVTTIADDAFANCKKLKSVKLGKGVTTIGKYSFSTCSSLTDIAIPASVTSIGEYAFSSCSKIVEIQNNSAIDLLSQKFDLGLRMLLNTYSSRSGSSKIETDSNGFVFYLNDNVSYLSDTYLIDYRGKDTNVILPDSYHGRNYEIHESAFYGNDKIVSISTGDGVQRINHSAFSECSALKSLTIGANVSSLYGDIVSGCPELTTLRVVSGNRTYFSDGNCIINTYSKTLVIGCKYSQIPNDGSVTAIGERAFANCTGLEAITLPNCLTYIGSSAFANCTGLKSIVIPDSVTQIGNNAFSGCENIRKAVIGKGVENVDLNPFSSCYRLAEIYNYSKLNIKAEDSENSGIGQYAFSVYTTDAESKIHTTKDGFVFYVDGDKIYLIGYDGNKSDITLPDTYNGKSYEIGRYAFYNRDDITSVDMGTGVTAIGKYSFKYCTNLKTVISPVSMVDLQNYAFDFCESLDYVYYRGTTFADWNKFNLGSGEGGNSDLRDANRYAYSEEYPFAGEEKTGRFWHYVDGKIEIWLK